MRSASGAPDVPPALESGTPGPFLGMCGSVTDDEVARAAGITAPLHAVRDPVGCEWNTGSPLEGVNVSFTWYRGSPIGRERSIDGAVGRRVQDVTIGGQPGFTSQSGRGLCEAGVGYGDDDAGDGDFFLWSVSYGLQDSPADACRAATALAEMTVERAQ